MSWNWREKIFKQWKLYSKLLSYENEFRQIFFFFSYSKKITKSLKTRNNSIKQICKKGVSQELILKLFHYLRNILSSKLSRNDYPRETFRVRDVRKSSHSEDWRNEREISKLWTFFKSLEGREFNLQREDVIGSPDLGTFSRFFFFLCVCR